MAVCPIPFWVSIGPSNRAQLMLDTAFFVISKLVWAIVSPDSLILLMALGAWVALRQGHQSLARRLLASCASLLLLIAIFPIGEWLIAPLEGRFGADPQLPTRVDGIIVLGGAIQQFQSRDWQQVELGPAADRLTGFFTLAQRYPRAQLLFSGGSGALNAQSLGEADFARRLFQQLGLGERAILFESESRNTYENVRNSRELLSSARGENWVLVTSAFHLPRAVGIFCQQQWPVIPYAVDHYSQRGNLLRFDFDLAANLTVLKLALREWLGLVAYRLSGRSSQLLPSEGIECFETGV